MFPKYSLIGRIVALNSLAGDCRLQELVTWGGEKNTIGALLDKKSVINRSECFPPF